jgi:hypothetical protein
MTELLAAANDFASNAKRYVHWFDEAVSHQASTIELSAAAERSTLDSNPFPGGSSIR